MTEIIDLAAEGFSRAFTYADAVGGHHESRPLNGGVQVRASLLGLLVTLLMGAGCLLAIEKGMVTGIVAASSKVPIPGAKVTLVAADGSRQSVTANQRGYYSFPSVEPATYILSAEAAGYQAVTRADVRVTEGTATTVDLLLAPATPPEPKQPTPTQQQPSYYDGVELKASAVKGTIDAAGYSSQAESPQRLLSEGPSLTDNALRAQTRGRQNPEAAGVESRLQQALRADPDSFDINHQLGEHYLYLDNLKDGIPYLEKAQELKPGDGSNGYDLALAYLETGSAAKAQILLQDLIRRKDTAELHNLLGKVDEALGDPPSAINEFQLAAQMDPSEMNIFDWGNELLLHETLEPATEAFKRGVARYPNSPRMYIGLGIAFYSRSSYDQAIKALCHASDLNPTDPRPYLFLGKMYNVSMGQADEVAKRMKKFMETNPDNALAYYYGALSLWKGSRSGDQGVDVARVESLFRKSMALDPRLADTHLQLGILYHDQHRDQDAIQEFQAAIRLNPDAPDAHYHLAQAYLRTGDQERGQEELRLYDKLHK